MTTTKYSDKTFDYNGTVFEVPFHDLFPICTETRSALALSIKELGILDPVKRWKGQNVIIDGHSRLEIANGLGIPLDQVPFRDIEAENLSQAMELGVQMNVHRRALDREQMAALCVKLRKEYEWSLQRIAIAVVLSKATVHRYIEGADDPDMPAVIVTSDGKRRPAKSAKPKADKPKDAEEVSDGSDPVVSPETTGSDNPQPGKPEDEGDTDAVDILEGAWGGSGEPQVSEKDNSLRTALQALGSLSRSLSKLGVLTQLKSQLQQIKDVIDSCREDAA